jgi:archaemetzincin
MPEHVIPDSAKREKPGRPVQWHTPYILDKLLKGKIPADGYALMAISEKDIYPGPGWNFVFGIASFADRVGVTSIFRLQNTVAAGSTDLLCLKRLFSIASHEIGHMFSIHHCNFAKCSMNGSNSLDETDRCVSRLCSECQQKLHWNIKYDNRKRLKELIAYFKKTNLPDDLALAEKDHELLQ